VDYVRGLSAWTKRVDYVRGFRAWSRALITKRGLELTGLSLRAWAPARELPVG